MDKHLSSSLELVVESWKSYLTDWNQAMRIGVWFLPVPAITFAVMFALRSAPDVANTLLLPFYLFSFIVIIWTEIRLFRWTLGQEKLLALGKDQEELTLAFRLIPGRLLVGLFVAITTIGGLVLFVFPGIWLGVSLQFATIAYLAEGKRGMHALARSHELVRGRWWSVLKRLVVGGVFLFLGTYVATSIVLSILSFISGSEVLQLALSDNGTNPLYSSVQILMNALYLMVFVPLFFRWMVRIYTGLCESQS